MSKYKNVLQNSPSLPSLTNKSSLIFTGDREKIKKLNTV